MGYDTTSKLSQVPKEPSEIKRGKLQPADLGTELLTKIDEIEQLNDKIIAVLKTIYDPEIPVDIWELGLIYKITCDDFTGLVNVDMTLTSPSCPVAETLPLEVEAKILGIPEVNNVHLELVWNPPWDRDMMSDVAKVELDMFY